MGRWMGVVSLALAGVVAGCGGSPTAPSAPGVSITGLVVQIQNDSDGSYGYIVSYTVHNGGPADATLTGIDALLSAKGVPLRSFNVGFPGGRSVPVSQTISPTKTTFTTPAGVATADSLTLTVHYTTGGGEQTATRTTPLG